MNRLPKILITGSDGQVGFELTRTLSPLGEVVALVRADLDLTDFAAITEVLNHHQPDIIVNPAAYTAVDKAETDADTAYAVNAKAPEIMAQWAQVHGAMLIHYSTDYVFDGAKVSAYTETDAIAPQSVYGASKAQGEQLIRAACAEHFIFRTSWVFGAHGSNFLKTMLKLMQSRDRLSVVNDQRGAPTSAFLLADVTAHIVRDAWRNKINATSEKTQMTQPNPYGTYHLSASGATTWFEYAQFIAELAEQAGLPLTVHAQDIVGIPSSEYPTPAARPTNSVLDSNCLQSTFDLNLPDWRAGVRHAFQLIHS